MHIINTESTTQIIKDLLTYNAQVKGGQKVLIVYDEDSYVSVILKKAYENALEEIKKELNIKYELLNFHLYTEEEWAIKLYNVEEGLVSKGDLVVLIQSLSFRISKFRVRLDLNQRGIFVIEHVRLKYLKEGEYQTYINSLTSDMPYYVKTTDFLYKKLLNAEKVEIVSKDGSKLLYDSKLEEPKKNIGDFSKSLGTLFPVGEIFTEPFDLEKVNGYVSIHAIPSTEQRTMIVKPFKAKIENGFLVSHDGPNEFDAVLDLIKGENVEGEYAGKVMVREMGFGLNKHISLKNPLYEVSSFERKLGYHISLGMKHPIYRGSKNESGEKKIPKNAVQRFHIDIYIDVDEIFVDGEKVFEGGGYLA